MNSCTKWSRGKRILWLWRWSGAFSYQCWNVLISTINGFLGLKSAFAHYFLSLINCSPMSFFHPIRGGYNLHQGIPLSSLFLLCSKVLCGTLLQRRKQMPYENLAPNCHPIFLLMTLWYWGRSCLRRRSHFKLCSHSLTSKNMLFPLARMPI